MAKKHKKKLEPAFIREWRKFRGFSQVQLADQIGITQGALSDLENGRFAYVQTLLETIAETLQCRPADLLARPPGTADGLRSIWDEIPNENREQVMEILKTFSKKAASDGL